jgi:hypothetical protein
VKTLWREEWRAALAERLRRINPETKPRWGRMNAAQMAAHLNDAIRMASGDLAVRSVGTPLRYPPLKQLVIYLAPIPKGVPTARELIARVDRAQWAEESAAFAGLLERFAARGPAAPMPDHPAFGRMSARAWGVLAYRHADHHLRQFGV